MNIRRTVFTPYPVFARMLMHFYLTYRCDVRGCERRINLVKSAGGSIAGPSSHENTYLRRDASTFGGLSERGATEKGVTRNPPIREPRPFMHSRVICVHASRSHRPFREQRAVLGRVAKGSVLNPTGTRNRTATDNNASAGSRGGFLTNQLRRNNEGEKRVRR